MNQKKDTIHPREFESIVNDNFVGSWSGEFWDKKSLVKKIHLNVEQIGERYVCTLKVGDEIPKIYDAYYFFGMNVLQADGFQMSPVSGNFASILIKNHPILPKNESIGLSK
ncbi:hypothetical protein [Leptospira sp. GIMC2001]|uniref:hypothetical protein n=1 Tax=Leptospira sp. GIMC2001 TaxID=1513297 RepID=UPI00234B2437|nr:hypothetical protein [Leptospira sp. GIMC2001]WCL49017.1 hypothetical protein O4O04_17250 [Leptospira sp. GIMC2001]